MDCDPGHDWRADRESASFVRYRCAACGSVCVAPKPVEVRGLVVTRVSSLDPEPDPSPVAEVPLWVTGAAR